MLRDCPTVVYNYADFATAHSDRAVSKVAKLDTRHPSFKELAWIKVAGEGQYVYRTSRHGQPSNGKMYIHVL
ncbi:hypothetical protein SeMB42_g04836 [Synchytrium endobioticum]|uniref:Uncharacterized protein n=1 Tax=Synchytrium endobioticum TaxID=286115 RepID=A0A507CWA7_9FUNG|nr:hypothetical protein SeMB42_g04836 [Synchytrium endobioticum]